MPASIIIYNSYLPEIARAEDRDTVSSHSWGLSYLSSESLLALNFVPYANYESLGLSEAQTVRISLGSAGLWWALFHNHSASYSAQSRRAEDPAAGGNATLIYIYVSVKTATQFYATAAVIGTVMGGSQALSRSIDSFMILKGQEAEYFNPSRSATKEQTGLGRCFSGWLSSSRGVSHSRTEADPVLSRRTFPAGPRGRAARDR